MKKRLSMILALVLVLTMFSGCGKTETTQPSAPETKAETVAAQTDAPETEAEDIEEDLAEITVIFYVAFPHSAGGVERVQAAINEITIPEINTQVTLSPIELGSWNQQASLMISSNEKVDLMPTFYYGPATYAAMLSQNQLLPLDDLLQEYGQGILSTVREDYMTTTVMNGQTYGVPAMKDEVSNVYLAMRTDILEELGLLEQAQNMTSMQDLEEIYKVVGEKTDLAPIVSSGAVGVLGYLPKMFTEEFAEAPAYEKLLNDYIVSFSDDPTKVVCLYETDAFEDVCYLAEEWFNAGYIYKDAANTPDDNVTIVRSGKGFSFMYPAQAATAEAGVAAAEYEMTLVNMGSGPVSTGEVNTIDWVIPTTATEPEAAMKFLNLMYTRKDIVDLMNYGVQGVDYIVKEDGTYTFGEGYHAGNAEYYDNLTWLFGNQFLSGVWEGTDPNVREISKELNANPDVSKILGFVASPNGLENEITAISNVYNEYFRGLSCGVLDVDTALPEFRAKLKDAGIDKVVASVQEQLDAWLVENPID